MPSCGGASPRYARWSARVATNLALDRGRLARRPPDRAADGALTIPSPCAATTW